MLKKLKIILLLSLILIPQTIFANAGTALMWIPYLQLVFGNLIIGIVEGLIIILIYKTNWLRSISKMISANYGSWIIGHSLVFLIQNFLLDSILILKYVLTFWIISLFFLYVLTALIEYPFINWIIIGNFSWRSKYWKISFIMNFITYTAMIFLYLSVSKFNFFTDLKVDQTLLDNITDIELLYINENNIYTGSLSNEFNSNKAFNIPTEIEYPHFYLIEDTSVNSIDLYLANYHGDTLLFLKSFINNRNKYMYPKLSEKYSWIIADFRNVNSRNWMASAGGWAIDGLTIRYEDKTLQNYAFEVPWMFWDIGSVSILSDTELICIINDRIIMINKDLKKVAFITRGYDYIVKKN